MSGIRVNTDLGRGRVGFAIVSQAGGVAAMCDGVSCHPLGPDHTTLGPNNIDHLLSVERHLCLQ